MIKDQCTEICGDGRRFVLACDDGNTFNGDGCSSSCNVEPGYLCSGGSSVSTDVCQKVDPSIKSLTLSLQEGYPIYSTGGIITKFVVNPAVYRSEEQVRNMFKVSFNPQTGKPSKIIITQNPSDPTEISCFFDYKNSLPSLIYTVTFDVTDTSLGSATLSWVYDTISNAVTSALWRELPSRDRLT